MPQVIEIGRVAVRSRAVGAASWLHLQHAEVDAHLDDLAAIATLHQAGLDHAGLEFPPLQGGVDVLKHYGLPSRRKSQSSSRRRHSEGQSSHPAVAYAVFALIVAARETPFQTLS